MPCSVAATYYRWLPRWRVEGARGLRRSQLSATALPAAALGEQGRAIAALRLAVGWVPDRVAAQLALSCTGVHQVIHRVGVTRQQAPRPVVRAAFGGAVGLPHLDTMS